MSLEKNRFTFTGRKAPFFGAVFKDVNYISDSNKIHLTEKSPEVISNWGFFINQAWWTTHFFQWSKKWETVMVKLKWEYYILFKEYIKKTKWIVTLKCMQVFEDENGKKIIDYLTKDEHIKDISQQIIKKFLWNIKNTISDNVNEVLNNPLAERRTILNDLVHN
ncbi:MAG: hypothetical protein ACD_49C00062G0015 [uncultured bacterium (gcode 4)]|uniref:Uncharacterized protein n=1 Tax=uncultured bacterium (gcode 4) TaxID=1234023 RepID=K2AWW1_9BACT|nr:MAG: hypothetical protein ACD_49C00062G0015 [uncultured bacterium (gcode 4)]